MQLVSYLCAGTMAFGLASAATAASPASTAREELASRQFLIGTWNCSYTVGPEHGTYVTTWSNALNGVWLKQTYDQAAQPNARGFVAEYFVGYDERRQGWVRFGAMTTGQYFAIRMTDAGPGNWTWKYISFFKRRTPESTGSDATFTRKSDTEYAIDGPTYQLNGATETEHHICKKATP